MPRAGLEPDKSDGSSPIVPGKAADSGPSDAESTDPCGSSAEPTVTLSHDSIAKGLGDARDAWTRSADPKALRRGLLELLRRLDEDE